MHRILPLAALITLSGCATPGSVTPEYGQTLAYGTPVALGEWVWLTQPYTSISPRKVIEDSRCPINARCVWAGRVLIEVLASNDREPDVLHAHDGAMSFQLEIDSTQPTTIFGGDVVIDHVEPNSGLAGSNIDADDYRFTISFTPRVSSD